MRYIQIEEAKAGMVIAKTIFDDGHRVLLGNNSVITQEYLERLQYRGLPGFYIEDDWSKDIEVVDIISPELRNEGIVALKKNDIDETLNVAKKIINQLLEKSVVSLDMMDLRTYDDYTYKHSVNVAVISSLIGMKMELRTDFLEELCIAAILHDIGKVLIDPQILNKPGRLTDDEYNIIKKHSEYGYDLLKNRLDISSRVKSAIMLHHENEDGTGYPKGYTDEHIYIYAKIIHVADVFDALTSKRPYKQAYARYEAAEYLMGSCDRMFCHEVVEAFLKAVPIYPKGTCVHLSDGKVAIVIANSENVFRPIIRFEDGEEIDMSDLTKYRNLTIVPENKVVVR